MTWFQKLHARSTESLKSLSPEDFVSLVRPKCQQIVTEQELLGLLKKGKKLRVKLGADPTGADLHLGHAVPLVLLRLFQRAGHDAHFIIGDFTARIGDPAGRDSARRELTDSDVKKNMKTYQKQIAKLIDTRRAKVHKNSAWLAKMNLATFFEHIAAISFSEIAQRDDFRNRIKAGSKISLREANYASLMAIDSLQLKADIEVCGIDQLINVMQAREVMSAAKLAPQVVTATPIIEGTAGDGRKMSKSFDNYIALADTAENQFGRIMSIPDHLMHSYYISFGDIYEKEISELDAFLKANPLEAKKELAMLIVSMLHDEKTAQAARLDFERKFGKKEYIKEDERVIKMPLPATVMDALIEAFAGTQSRSRIRTLIEQGAVRRVVGEGNEMLNTIKHEIRSGDLVKVGKMHLFRFVNN